MRSTQDGMQNIVVNKMCARHQAVSKLLIFSVIQPSVFGQITKWKQHATAASACMHELKSSYQHGCQHKMQPQQAAI